MKAPTPSTALLALALAALSIAAAAAAPTQDEVASWASALGSQLSTLGSDVGYDKLQEAYDESGYSSSNQQPKEMFDKIQADMIKKLSDRMAALKKLRDDVEAAYSSGSGDTSFTECCKVPSSTTEYSQAFLTEVNMQATCSRFPSGANSGISGFTASLKVSDSVLGAAKANQNAYPSLKWQYYGTQDGLFTIYPAKDRSSCSNYDPRYRPWFVGAATPQAKDIVIVLDSSGSMDAVSGGKTRMQLAKEAAYVVLDTLSINDYVNVVDFDSVARPPEGTNVAQCFRTTLAEASPRNRATLKTFISNEVLDSGGTYYKPALQKAFSMLSQGKSDGNTGGGLQAILFLTDGDASDASEIRSYVNTNAGDVKILTYGLGSGISTSGETLLQDMASASGGKYTNVPDGGDLRTAMASYYDFFAAPANEPVWSPPYFDSSGLGLIVTASLPVFHGGNLKGVVGIDLTMTDLVADAAYLDAGEYSFAFVADDRGRLLSHPMLPLPGETSNDPMLMDLSVLENDAQFKLNVRDPMIAGQNGTATVTLQRALSRGDVRLDGVRTVSKSFDVNFGPVTGSPLRVGLAIASSEVAQRRLTEAGGASNLVYHRVDLNSGVNKCKNTGSMSSKASSGAKLAPDAFVDPSLYLETAETSAMVTKWNRWIAGTASFPPDPFTLKDQTVLRRDLIAANALESRWLETGADGKWCIAWRYVGTRAGAFVIYPATPMPTAYSPLVRPWYQRAVATTGLYTLSTPYVDASSGSIIITLAKAVYEGGTTAAHTSADTVQAVLGIDFTLNTVQSMLKAHTGCGDSTSVCFIMDDSGFIVWHPKFTDGSLSDTQLSGYFIGSMYPGLADTFISTNVISKHRCNAYEDLQSLLFYTSDTSTSISRSGTAADCSSSPYSISTVAGTNVLLVAVEESSCLTSASCNCGKQLYSRSDSGCQCPGPSALGFDTCAGTYELGSDGSNPACPAAPLTRAMVTLDISTSGLAQCFDAGCFATEAWSPEPGTTPSTGSSILGLVLGIAGGVIALFAAVLIIKCWCCNKPAASKPQAKAAAAGNNAGIAMAPAPAQTAVAGTHPGYSHGQMAAAQHLAQAQRPAVRQPQQHFPQQHYPQQAPAQPHYAQPQFPQQAAQQPYGQPPPQYNQPSAPQYTAQPQYPQFQGQQRAHV